MSGREQLIRWRPPRGATAFQLRQGHVGLALLQKFAGETKTMSKRAATSYDVARAAGVSQSAVSRAFSTTASIADATRQHILNVAMQMGYQPNAIARSMSTARKTTPQRSGMVGIIVTRLQDPFFAQTMARFSHGLQARGWHILLFTVDTEAEVDEALNALMSFKVDGIVILSALLSDRMAAACQAQGTPVMLFNRSADLSGVNSVRIANREGGRAAADYLIEAGHQRIAYLGGGASDPTSREREAGFAERLAEAGLKPFLRENGDYTFDSGHEAGLRIFARSERPDAVFCASDVMALGVLHAARHELGLDVPRDFSLIGFDDIPSAAWPGHALTTIRQPIGAMVQDAVRILVDRMETPDLPPQVLQVPGILILRATVRRAAPA